jgi:hypothetical protein
MAMEHKSVRNRSEIGPFFDSSPASSQKETETLPKLYQNFTKTLPKLYRILPNFNFSPRMTQLSRSADGTTAHWASAPYHPDNAR